MDSDKGLWLIVELEVESFSTGKDPGFLFLEFWMGLAEDGFLLRV